MTEVLLVFGSKSNSNLYKPLMQKLRKTDISFELRIASAHKSPKLLEKIISKSNAKVIVAGAGLSAALPGAVAAQTIKPVIGLPAGDNFQGLDALLSVQQMPPGVPVLAVGVDARASCARELNELLEKKTEIILVKKKCRAFEKAKKTLAGFGTDYSTISKPVFKKKDAVYIDFVDLKSRKLKPNNKTVINVPITNKKSKAKDSLKLLKLTKSGLWVGLNRGENAAIAAIQLCGKFSLVRAHRSKMRKKLANTNKKESVRFW